MFRTTANLCFLVVISEAGVVVPAGEGDEAAALAPAAVGEPQVLSTPAVPATLSYFV